MKKPENCTASIFDELWGEYKCRVKEHVVESLRDCKDCKYFKNKKEKKK